MWSRCRILFFFKILGEGGGVIPICSNAALLELGALELLGVAGAISIRRKSIAWGYSPRPWGTEIVDHSSLYPRVEAVIELFF